MGSRAAANFKAAFFLGMLALTLHATAHPIVNGAPYVRAQRLVDVGNGRRMNIYCLGSGSPTVILDSGLGVGSGTLDWNHVQPVVAKFTRVCSYDRAGYGFSDPGPLPRDSNAVVSDLRTLLRDAGIAPPFVLVGHSIAGLYEPLFADRYPNDVAGMVLVDPSTPGQEKLLTTSYPNYAPFEATQLAWLRECSRAAQNGLLHEKGPLRKKCIPAPDPDLSAAVNADLARMLEAPGPWIDSLSEFQSLGRDNEEVERSQRNYGAMPLIVLTAVADEKSMQKVMGASNAQVAEVQSGWTALHDRIASLSTRGVNCVIPRVGHFIQIDRPSVVINAIRQVIGLSETTDKPSCSAL